MIQIHATLYRIANKAGAGAAAAASSNCPWIENKSPVRQIRLPSKLRNHIRTNRLRIRVRVYVRLIPSLSRFNEFRRERRRNFKRRKLMSMGHEIRLKKNNNRKWRSFPRSCRPNNKVTEDGYPFQIFTPFSRRGVKLMRLGTPLLVGGQLRWHKYCQEPCWPHGTDTALNNVRACVLRVRRHNRKI